LRETDGKNAAALALDFGFPVLAQSLPEWEAQCLVAPDPGALRNLIEAGDLAGVQAWIFRMKRTGDDIAARLDAPMPVCLPADEGEEELTPLMLAARLGQADIVDALIEAGASADARDGLRRTALMHACCAGKETCALALLRHGAQPEQPDAIGNTPLMLAAMSGHEGVVRVLLERGARHDARGANGGTALIAAAANGAVGVCRLLVDVGTDLWAQDGDGCIAEATAQRAGHASALAFLREERWKCLRQAVEAGDAIRLERLLVVLRHQKIRFADESDGAKETWIDMLWMLVKQHRDSELILYLHRVFVRRESKATFLRARSHYLSASTMSAKWMNAANITSSLSKREKMRRKPLRRRNSRSTSFLRLYISRS
jgi:hypothetical protein